MSTPDSAQERRRSVRNRTLIGGQIVFDQRRSTLDCMIRNISEQGAMVRFSATVALPDLVELHVPSKHETWSARFRWRDETSGGLEFMRGNQAVDEPIQLALMRRVKLLEQENAQLRARIEQLSEGSI